MPRKNIPYILNSARKSTIFGFYTALIVCILAPLMVISGNPEDFETLSFSYTFFEIMGKEWFTTFLTSSLTAFIAISCHKKCERVIFCIIIALALFSFYLPLNSGLIDGKSLLKFNTINLLLGLTLATIAIRFFKYRHKIILILIAGPLIQSSL